MSNESRLMALLEEGNPATEVGMRDWTEIDAASYLAALEPRSSDMTQSRTKSKNPTGIRRTGVAALAAVFALVVIVGIGFAFFDRTTTET